MKKILIATRKGLVIMEKSRNGWKIIGDHFLGVPVAMIYVNPHDHSWWTALDHGHWGIKLQHSRDEGNSWQEILPPAYPTDAEIKPGVAATLKYIWAFCAQKDQTLWVGSEPGGLFSSQNGSNFTLIDSLWNHPSREKHWFGGGRDYPGIHSIIEDPRDPDHLYIGISCAGVFETYDRGQSWKVRNVGLRADYLPIPDVEVGHDPHLLTQCQKHPQFMWQQNHCGIFKSENGGETWLDVTDKKGPANFGFTIAADAENPALAWVVPGISDEVRVAVNRSLCVCRTEDGGKSWQDLRNGLPQTYAYDIVYRHSLIQSKDELVFGTTTGNLYYSNDGGDGWTSLQHNLAMVYCLAYTD